MHKYIVRIAGSLKKWLENYLSNENEKQSRKILRRLEELRRKNQEAEQQNCSHLAGCLGEIADYHGRTSIVWHVLNTGEIVGICTNCFRYFFPSDPDYNVWRKRASFNKISSAGITLSAWGKKAEPHLARFVDPPPPIPMPPIKYQELENPPNPWLLNPDGSPDPFFENVDFGLAEAEAKEAAEESAGKEEDAILPPLTTADSFGGIPLKITYSADQAPYHSSRPTNYVLPDAIAKMKEIPDVSTAK